MIPVICRKDGRKFQVEALASNLKCVCGSVDLDFDDGVKQGYLIEWDSPDGPGQSLVKASSELDALRWFKLNAGGLRARTIWAVPGFQFDSVRKRVAKRQRVAEIDSFGIPLSEYPSHVMDSGAYERGWTDGHRGATPHDRSAFATEDEYLNYEEGFYDGMTAAWPDVSLASSAKTAAYDGEIVAGHSNALERANEWSKEIGQAIYVYRHKDNVGAGNQHYFLSADPREGTIPPSFSTFVTIVQDNKINTAPLGYESKLAMETDPPWGFANQWMPPLQRLPENDKFAEPFKDENPDGEGEEPKEASRKLAYSYEKVGESGDTVTLNFWHVDSEQGLRYILRNDFGISRPFAIYQDGPSTWQVDVAADRFREASRKVAFRACDRCGGRMAPFLPRKRIEDELVCNGCYEKSLRDPWVDKALDSITNLELTQEPTLEDFPRWTHREYDEKEARLRASLKRHLALRKKAHESADDVVLYHCPFCGSGQIVKRADGTVECSFCNRSFSVRLQPERAAVPQTNEDGQPFGHPDMEEVLAEPEGEMEAANEGPEGVEENDRRPLEELGSDPLAAEGDEDEEVNSRNLFASLRRRRRQQA